MWNKRLQFTVLFAASATLALLTCDATQARHLNTFHQVATETLSARVAAKPKARRIVRPARAVRDAFKRPPPGSFDAAARAFRTIALLRYVAYQKIIPPESLREVDKILERNSAPSVDAAWRLFFAGAITSSQQLDANSGTAAFFNPIYDGAVLTRWHRDKGVWTIENSTVVLGSALRKTNATPAPSWIVAGTGLPQTLSASMPTRAAFESFQTQSSVTDKDILLARIAALIGNLRQLNLGPGEVDELNKLFASIKDGTAKASGTGAVTRAERNADSLATFLPAQLRNSLTCFGAFPTRDGVVLVYGPMMFPGVAYLVGRERGRSFNYAAVSIQQK
jgi:hypothetical protein